MARLDLGERRYPLDQSPLYRLANKRKLAEILCWRSTPKELDTLANRSDNYKEFTIGASPKKRAVQEPKQGLSRIHTRLARLLLRIEVPDYLHSGIRRRSYVTNAKAHVQVPGPTITLDIERFYESTSWHHVFRLFVNEFEMSEDVAGLLASLACYSGAKGRYLPTGSPLSQILAFRAHEKMFDAIAELAAKRGGLMTLYVDDVTISMPHACPSDIKAVGRIIEARGLAWHKSEFYGPVGPKHITGTVLSPKGMRAPNRLHRKLKQAREEIQAASDPIRKSKSIRVAAGVAQSVATVDPRYQARAVALATEAKKDQIRK